MANKKTKKKPKKTGAKKGSSLQKAATKTFAKKKSAPKKKLVKKGLASPKPGSKTTAVGKKAAAAKSAGAPKRQVLGRTQSLDSEAFEFQERRTRAAGQSGDLQGLSDAEVADSESVDELVEEGNAFEADVVSGVERAGNDGEKEVHTHEVPEDDVPGEYLDEE